MVQPIKEEIRDLMQMVWDHKIIVTDAEAHADAIVMELAGRDEVTDSEKNESQPPWAPSFPDSWSSEDRLSAKKTWVHARNHLRRQMRARYRD